LQVDEATNKKAKKSQESRKPLKKRGSLRPQQKLKIRCCPGLSSWYSGWQRMINKERRRRI
jgi:hypothetical protein